MTEIKYFYQNKSVPKAHDVSITLVPFSVVLDLF